MAGRDEEERPRRIINYDPLPSQRRFHDLETRIKGYSGPVGSGKSAALCHEAIDLAFKNDGRTGLIGAPTYNMLRDATLDAFQEILRANEIGYELNRSSFTLTILECGSRILFRSLDDPEKLRGSNLAWFGVDELTYCSEDAWTRLEARLRDPQAEELGGFAVWTPKGFDWVYRRFVGEPVEGYGLVQAEAFENTYLLDAAPDYYDRLKASYDDAFYQQEVLGGYLNLQAGQVYYAFDRERNTGDWKVDPSEPLIWSWDFNVNPMASVIAQKRDGVVHVLDEIYLTTSSTPEVCEEFARRYGEHRGGVKVYGDASGEQRHSVSRFSDFELIRGFFRNNRQLNGTVRTRRSNPPVRDRINLVNASLKSADGVTRLLVDRSCRRVIRDLEQVTFKPDSGVIDKDREAELTHLSDALGYLLWQELRTSEKVGERGQRLI